VSIFFRHRSLSLWQFFIAPFVVYHDDKPQTLSAEV